MGDMTLVRLGMAVRTIRHRQGLTMVELGRRAGVSRGPVQRLEAGRGADIAAGVIVALFVFTLVTRVIK